MITSDIKTDWSKVPGPNFFGPDGNVKDVEDWRIVVKAHLLLQAAQEVSRFEASEPMLFDLAKNKCVRMIEQRVYGEVWNQLVALRDELRFHLDSRPLGDGHPVLKKYDDIMALVRPSP